MSGDPVAYTWNSFQALFSAVYTWTWDIIHMLDSIIIIQIGDIEYSFFDFGISMLAFAVLLIIYSRLRH